MEDHMQRMLLLWSLLIGLALVGADVYVERGHASALPSYEGGTLSSSATTSQPGGQDMWEDGTPIPPIK
jgi:hypothetical protein